MMIFFVRLLAVSLLFISVQGKKCFECHDAARPYDCRVVVECSSVDDICFLDQIITGGGLVLFNSGCRPQAQCKQHRKRDIVERADILTCSECCATDYCNQNGCGYTAPSRTSRGPYCYTCASQLSPTTCRDIGICPSDQTCLLTYSAIDNFFTSGCAPKTRCQTVQSHIIGRNIGTGHGSCHVCCDQDFCNDNCTQALLVLDGHWSHWGHWSHCSVSCGHGQKHRSRSCNKPAPQNGDDLCQGDSLYVKNCSKHDCKIDGHWSEWGHWSQCDVTCGQGHISRSRSCDNPVPQNGGHVCIGDSLNLNNCTKHACKVDGGWSAWQSWSACSRTCGNNGTKHRQRNCDNPRPQYNGAMCSGDVTQSTACPNNVCPVDGGWSAWQSWSACSKTCGHDGSKHRQRNCDNPTPQYNGAMCSGDVTQSTACPNNVCPDAHCLAIGYSIVPVQGTNNRLCLKFMVTRQTWHRARSVCQNIGGDLVTIDNQNVDHAIGEFLRNTVHMHPGNDFHVSWVGAHDKGRGHDHHSSGWEWASDPRVPFDYHHFDHHEGPGGCATVTWEARRQSAWWPVDCDEYRRFLCSVKL